jgi:hypothetical protein
MENILNIICTVNIHRGIESHRQHVVLQEDEMQ